MKNIFYLLCVGIMFFASAVNADSITYHSISLSSYANSTSGRTDLTGDVMLGGIPFSIPATNNSWDTNYGSGGELHYIDIVIGMYGVTEAHTLINTSWGQWGVNWVSVEFFGNKGAYYKKSMIGGDDIRDWAGNEFTNSINGITSICVWGGYNRVDKQYIDLPSEFDTQTLTTIRMSDWGYSWDQGNPPQRSFLYGLTVGTVPEPTTITLLGIGMLSLIRRKK